MPRTIFLSLMLILLCLQNSFTIAVTTDIGDSGSVVFISNTASRQVPVTIEQFSDGSSFIEMDLTTPGAGGLYHNATPAVTIPKNAEIQSATFKLEGLSTPIVDNVLTTIDYTDTGGTEAYGGQVFADPPTEQLQDLKLKYKFNSVHRTNISSLDSVNVTNISAGIGSHGFHMFQVNLSGEQFGAVNFTWVGHGTINTTPFEYNSKLFYWTESEFKILSMQIDGGGTDAMISSVLDDPMMLDASGNIHIIVISPAETADGIGTIFTDFVEVSTLKNGTGLSFPFNISVDIGNTGIVDNTISGELQDQLDVTQGLRSAFQEAVDSAGGGYGDLVVPIRLATEHAGRLNISGLQVTYILDVKPELALPIPNSTVILEDSGWTTSNLSLPDFFNDHYGLENQSYEIVYKQDASEVDCRLDPGSNTLEFFTDKNFYGTSEFRVAATNKGDDNIAGNSDDMTTNSNLFHVTVEPTNDAPVFNRLEFPDGHLKTVMTGSIKLITTSERAFEDTFFTFNVSAVDPDGDTPIYSSNITDGAGGDDIAGFSLHPLTGTVEFTPGVEHVGMLYFNITVTDLNGSTPLSDHLDVELLIDDVNDHPVILTEGPFVAFEDRWNYFQLETFDEEATQLVFRSNVTDGKGTDEIADFNINRDTGEIAYYPVQADVGSFTVNVSVEDGEGVFGYGDIRFVVRNVNDAPVITNVGSMAAVKNEFLLFEVNETEWLNLTLGYADEDGDRLSFSAASLELSPGLPVGFDIDPGNGTIVFHANQLASGTKENYFINITASDGNTTNGMDFVWLEVQVNKLNRAPVVTDLDYDVNEGRVTFSVDADDPEGGELRIIWDFGDGSPKVTSYGPGDRNHTYSGPGNYTVTIKVLDPNDAFTTYSIIINLTDDDFPAPTTNGKPKDDEGSSAGLVAAIVAVILCIIFFIIIIFMIIRRKKEEFRRSREEVKKMLAESSMPDKPVFIDMKGEGKDGEEGGEEGEEDGEKKGVVQTTLLKFGDIFASKKSK